MKDVKMSKYQEAKTEVSYVAQSLLDLLEAVSLIIVTGVTIWAARGSLAHIYWLNPGLNPVLIAGCVVALRAGNEFLKYLKRGK